MTSTRSFYDIPTTPLLYKGVVTILYKYRIYAVKIIVL